MKFENVNDVAEWRLCVGCGVCAYICSENKVRLVDVVESGIRPLVDGGRCSSCSECLKACPGLESRQEQTAKDAQYMQALSPGWGPILEVWEGYAGDPEIRYSGSSGGAATAIALYCLEKIHMQGVLHVSQDLAHPTRNISVYSRTKAELLAATGSRYSPASPCANLGMIEKASGLSLFMGKPCDVEGLRKAQALRRSLSAKIGLAISIFCAGTPSSLGTQELLESVGVDAKDVAELRYRGKGWPGNFEVMCEDDTRKVNALSYKNAWGFLQKYRPYRCHLCPDGTGEFADISCGDPWYREIVADESGHSLLLVRTEKGRDILRGAINAGYLKAGLANPNILHKSQSNLFNKRAAIWGRLLAFKLFGLPIPRYGGFPLFSNWLTLSLSDKARSVFGTMRRILQRKYWKPEKHI